MNFLKRLSGSQKFWLTSAIMGVMYGVAIIIAEQNTDDTTLLIVAVAGFGIIGTVAYALVEYFDK
jgi:threonine dehydrogenase-like Zn-dependent dehydrogenase